MVSIRREERLIMFGKSAVQPALRALLVEAYASSTTGTVLETKAKEALQWVRNNYPKDAEKITDEVSERCDALVLMRRKEQEDAEKSAPVPRKAIVPDDKADEVIKLWVAWRCNDKGADASLPELYALEKVLYAVCPDMLQWGDSQDYDVDIYNGKVVVTEVLED